MLLFVQLVVIFIYIKNYVQNKKIQYDKKLIKLNINMYLKHFYDLLAYISSLMYFIPTFMLTHTHILNTGST